MLSDSSNKKYSYFLITVIGCVVILTIPMMYGHLLHEGHLFYIAIHETGFILSSFLTVMALIAYKKTKIKRMMFSSAAFGVLSFGQGEVMYQEMNTHVVDMTSSAEVLEYCIVAMTILFALGIFYKH